jgi:hypothetical protein
MLTHKSLRPSAERPLYHINLPNILKHKPVLDVLVLIALVTLTGVRRA